MCETGVGIEYGTKTWPYVVATIWKVDATQITQYDRGRSLLMPLLSPGRHRLGPLGCFHMDIDLQF